MSRYAIIIVTHNSQHYLPKAMASILQQIHLPTEILIVDSGSREKTYLEKWSSSAKIILTGEDIGFAAANNIGFKHLLTDAPYILLLNPDAMLTPAFCADAMALMDEAQNHRFGVLTGQLLGYQMDKDQPSGLWDSTGVFCRWYGKWYDRDQGKICRPTYHTIEELPAICGALMFCRRAALESVELAPGKVMDSSFFMYKEDIDLSIRLRDKGWQLMFAPSLIAYHCRGWNRNRQEMPQSLRLYSARNELRIHLQQLNPIKIGYSLAKYLGVKYLNI